jgi:hypothetical protein
VYNYVELLQKQKTDVASEFAKMLKRKFQEKGDVEFARE